MTMKRILEQHKEAQSVVGDKLVIYTALQGSQNYNLNYELSDVDSKSIVLPSLSDIIRSKQPLSTTHVCENDEHIDLKDIRLMFECFRKQNINFIEILFTDYYTYNPEYSNLIAELRDNAEAIARYNPFRAIKCMKGMALEKQHALKHPYPSKVYELEKYGYDPKQLSHIVRLDGFLKHYIEGDSYKNCLTAHERDFIMDIKRGSLPLAAAESVANTYVNNIVNLADITCEKISPESNAQTEEFLNDILYEIMTKGFKKELEEK